MTAIDDHIPTSLLNNEYIIVRDECHELEILKIKRHYYVFQLPRYKRND